MKQIKIIKDTTTRPKVLYVLMPFILTAIFFAPVLGFDLLNWDDKEYIMDNPLLRDFSILKLFTLFWMGNYHPLTMLLCTLGYKITELHGFYFHASNLGIHLFNVYLVFRLTEKLVKNNLFVAMFTALLFGVHPMHIESVAWVAELKDVLYTMFFLLSLNMYLLFVDKGGKERYLMSLLFFLLSLLARGQAVVLTPVILLLDFLGKRKYTRSVIAEKIPFLVFSILFGLLALKAQQAKSALSYDMILPHESYLYGFYNFILYLLKAVYPGALAGVHPYSLANAGLMYVYAILFFLFFLAALWITRKSRPLVFFGLAFFVVTISIVVKFIPVGEALIAERYTYIPYIGLFLIVSLFFSWMLNNPKYKAAGIVIMVLYMGSLLVPGYFYLKSYKNSETYWLNTIKEYPDYWRAHFEVALYFRDNNRNEESMDHLTRAISLVSPTNRRDQVRLHNEKACMYIYRFSDFSGALEEYQKVYEYDSMAGNLNLYLGYCYSRLHRMEEASRFLQRHLSRDSTGLDDAYSQRAVLCIDFSQNRKRGLRTCYISSIKDMNRKLSVITWPIVTSND